MLAIPANARFFLCEYPTDLRKSFEGLSILIEELFPGEIFTGAFFVFLNKPRNQIKVLFWDGDGFVIWNKRLQKGIFPIKSNHTPLNRCTFFMLLEGIIAQRVRSQFSL